MENKKNLRWFITACCLIVLVAICGYVAGRREAGKESDPLREEIKLITDSLKINKKKYFNLKDSLLTNTVKHEEKIDIINEIKKAIRNEISKNKTTIGNLHFTNDVELYVDSIRSAGGFN